MEKFDLKKYNRLCAELLGFVNVTPTDKDFNIHEHPTGVLGKTMIETNFTNLFTEDYNWIMEVVEKIENLYSHPNKAINFDIQSGQIEVFQRPYTLDGNHQHEVIYLGDGYINNSKKQALIPAIWTFLNWYNQNKLTQP